MSSDAHYLHRKSICSLQSFLAAYLVAPSLPRHLASWRLVFRGPRTACGTSLRCLQHREPQPRRRQNKPVSSVIGDGKVIKQKQIKHILNTTLPANTSLMNATKAKQSKNALAGNRTRAPRVAGEDSTTEPPMPSHYLLLNRLMTIMRRGA